MLESISTSGPTNAGSEIHTRILATKDDTPEGNGTLQSESRMPLRNHPRWSGSGPVRVAFGGSPHPGGSADSGLI
jgi:hypothetical protein